MRVTHVITILLISVVTFSCTEKKEPKVEYKLPEKVEHPDPGKMVCLSPKEFIDKLKEGTITDFYFLQEDAPEDPSYIVELPGMTTIYLGQIYFIADTCRSKPPFYLMCLYGDDSRRTASDLSLRGFDCYYVDGGSYRLSKEMREHNWSVTANSTVTKKR